MRTKQREATRGKIIKAAISAISESGFDGTSTRAIANRAEVSQGLLSYHFKSKELLWRAAADYLFSIQGKSIRNVFSSDKSEDPHELHRNVIRQLVYFHAEHPEFLRFILEPAMESNERTRWLVDTYMRSTYQLFGDVMVDIPKADLPHAFYAIAGASSVIFAVPNRCKYLTGVSPDSKVAIKRHADYIANLIIPVRQEG
jgi:TetR/AcrR family transcriptional regulator